MTKNVYRKKIKKKNFHKTQSLVLVKREFWTKYKNTPARTSTNIKTIVNRFKKTGSILPLPNQRRPTTQKRNDAKIAIEKLFSEFLNLLINKVSAAVQVSSSLARNILKQDLQMKPYKIPVHQQLKPPD